MSDEPNTPRYRTRDKNPRQGHAKKPLPDASNAIRVRLNILFAVIFALFLILLGRLYYMQVIDKKFYADKLAQSGYQTTVTEESPRGQIFDATGQPLATTTQTPAVTFTRTAQITSEEMRSSAQLLAPVLSQYVDTTTLTTRDKKDYYLSDPKNLAAITLTEAEQFNKNGTKKTAGEIYELQVSKVPDSAVANFSQAALEATAIYKQENATSLYSTAVLVSGNITPAQQAEIASQESKLPGIAFGNAWDHKANTSSLLAPLIGTISTTKAGLPADQAAAYLKKGYAMNDRVGTSYLEQQYESVLQGQQTKTKVVVNAKGVVTQRQTLQTGSAGENLKLTIDSKFEEGVQNILQNEVTKMQQEGFAEYSTGVYAVVLNPKTGAVLAANGLDRDPKTGDTTADAAATVNDAFEPGSTVKPATITSGWQAGVLTGNQTLNDQEIDIQGSAPITSWYTHGLTPTNVVQALAVSSNTYAIQVALMLNGTPYSPNMMISGDYAGTLTKLRKTYAQYGLGTSTGIDLPAESTGLLTPASQAPGSSIEFEAFGQYDTYTPMQMAAYAATLANAGKRIAPHLVAGIYDDAGGTGLGNLVKNISPKTEDTVSIDPANMSLIQQGMYDVVNGPGLGGYTNTGFNMAGSATTIAAKDGEAQVYINGVQTTTNNVVAYAPASNPQIAVAVMCPNVAFIENKGVDGVYEINQFITKDIVNLYSQMYGFK
ncbi:MAG: penicillin-binding protein 2 [Streptococcaceae bacterium]|jgi:penicillin-binding protein 2B|nr:penicillin-binding protein 2 [Streptococcaceae bacterium]